MRELLGRSISAGRALRGRARAPARRRARRASPARSPRTCCCSSSIRRSSRSAARRRTRNLLASPELLAARGVELFEVERGGDVTFHGPGQLVGYPIVDLKRHKQDLHWYLRQVEEALIRAVAPLGIAGGAERRATPASGRSGRKIASIGVHARDWVTWHGFALNVTTDLSYFDLIVPCGIAGVDDDVGRARAGHAPVTRALSLEHAVRARVADAFCDVFELELATLDRAGARFGSAAPIVQV